MEDSRDRGNKKILINKVINRNHKYLNSYDLYTKDTNTYNKKTKESNSKKNSNKELNFFSSNEDKMRTVEGMETPLTINVYKVNKSPTKRFLSPEERKIKRKNIILEKNEEEEDNIDNINNDIINYNNFYNRNNIFESIISMLKKK